MTLNIFSCVFWPSGYHLWRNVYLDLLTIFDCFFLIGRWLLNNIVMVFTIHQHESAIGMHVPPPSWVPSSRLEFLASYIKLSLAILHKLMYMFQCYSLKLSLLFLTVSKSLFFMSVSLCCPACRIVRSFYILYVCISIYICLCFYDLLHSV